MKVCQSQNNSQDSLHPYCKHRHKITEEDRILYKQHRLTILQSESWEIQSTTWITIQETRLVSQPERPSIAQGLSKDIETSYHQCRFCALHTRSQQKETIQSTDIPQKAWYSLSWKQWTIFWMWTITATSLNFENPSLSSKTVIQVLEASIYRTRSTKPIISHGDIQHKS